jgi:cysteinyl-tRNA synthetase
MLYSQSSLAHWQISGSGVYFDVEAYGVARYCAFASLSLPPTHEVADDEADAASTRVHKRSGRDFVLWRSLRSAAADQAGAVWSSPWGDGRPGWHIECSAVCEAHFGATLDVRTATLRVAIRSARADGCADGCAAKDFPCMR